MASHMNVVVVDVVIAIVIVVVIDSDNSSSILHLLLYGVSSRRSTHRVSQSSLSDRVVNACVCMYMYACMEENTRTISTPYITRAIL